MIKDKSSVYLGEPLRCRHLCGIPLGSLYWSVVTTTIVMACSPEHLERYLTEGGTLWKRGKAGTREIEIMEGLVSLHPG